MRNIKRTYFGKPILLIILADGLLWLKSSSGKFSSGNFVDSLGGTLKKFSSNNPYPWFKSFLDGVAIPNSGLFGTLILYGELLVAISIVVGSLYLLTQRLNKSVASLLALGLVGAAFLNLIFYFAAGWTSPSTEEVNLMMLSVEVVGLLVAAQVVSKGN